MPSDSLADAFGELYGEWRYDALATLTFTTPVSGDRAIAETKRWMRRLEKLGHGRVSGVITAEIGRFGRLHTHALLQNTVRMSPRAMKERWYAGRAHVRPCVDSQKAARYLFKHAGSERLVGFEDNLPVRRQGSRRSLDEV